METLLDRKVEAVPVRHKAGWLCCGVLSLLPVAARCQQLPLPAGGAQPELERARLAVADHRWREAEELLRAFLARDTRSPEASYLLAFTLFREDRPKESLEAYTRAATLRRPTARDLQSVALDYVLLKDYTDADRWIMRSEQMEPGDGETWYALGRIRYTENRFGDAVASFERALTLMPRSVKVENNLGLALEGLNEPEQAIAAYKQAIAWQAEGKQSSEPLLNLGILLSDRTAFDEALPLLQEAATLAPEDPRVHSALGTLYRRREEWTAAQAEFSLALAARPEDAALHYQLGQVYRREGMEAQAKAELARAAELNGTHSLPSP